MTSEPIVSKHARDFYAKTLKILSTSEIPFLVGGTWALGEYANISRPTKDLDLFCKHSDYPRLVQFLEKHGFKTELTDDRWIVKAIKGKDFIDFIFNSPSGICPVDDTWIKNSPTTIMLGSEVRLVPVEEMIWSKIFSQERTHFDGADVNHMILKMGEEMDWRRLVLRMEAHWEILLSALINFRFVYPSNKECIPHWVMEELVKRLNEQLSLPSSHDKVCRGPLLARLQYLVDIKDWGFQVIT